MKKNRMMRLASILLVCVLLTTSVISGTFAKYTTTASGTSTARVAKWGFNTETITVELFAKQYKDPSDTDITVNSSETVVAPGTKNEVTITLIPDAQVAPEVDYHFEASVASGSSNADLLNKLVWKFNGGSELTFSQLQTAIATAYNDNYEAGNLPAKTFTVSWEWPFEVGADDAEIAANDAADTTLGNGSASLAIVFSFTAEQID